MAIKEKLNIGHDIKPIGSNQSNGSQNMIEASDIEEAEVNLKLAETGYAPELKRNFSKLKLCAIGFSLTNSWYGISASIVLSIQAGGPIIVVYGIIIVASISTCVGISLAELCSMKPNSGGQYVWSMILAPKKYAGIAGYLCGSFAWAGSVFTSASVTLSIATALVGCYVLGSGDPNKTVETWQVFVTYEIVNVLLMVANIWERPLPTITAISFYVSLGSFLIIFITILARSGGEFQDPSFVFVKFQNGTGWASSGIAFIVGLINPNWSFSCLDCATHMSEETLHPEKDIPFAILSTVAIGFVTSFSFVLAIFFCIKDIDGLYSSTTGVPILDIFYQVLNSKAGAICLEVLIILTAIGCNIASHTWQARLCWSFSRDNGLPMSKWWSKIDKNTRQPINAHFFSCAWCAVIGCIYMGSTTAYNAMVVACIIFLLLSYCVPVTFLLLKGRENIVPGPFWLGKIGFISNIVLICWTFFGLIFYSFPAVQPVTAGNMNYVCVVFGVYFLFCLIDWQFRAKHSFITLDQRESGKKKLTQQVSNQLQNIVSMKSQSVVV